ncbi:UNVERIFIED_CONTAM: hypothetical protein NCL1_51815 [Trichonephila clavipes]
MAALNDSTKWKGRVLDYSRTNREIMKEKRNARRLIIRNFLYHPQNPLSMDIYEKSEMSAETSENLKGKDNDFKNVIHTKSFALSILITAGLNFYCC